MIEDPKNSNRRITNPGCNIPTIFENRLKALVYTAKVYPMIRITSNHDTMSSTRLRLLGERSKLIKDHNDPRSYYQSA